MKTSELVYMINDELKLLSDDSNFTIDHILFLCSKYRAYIIKTDNLNKKLLQLIGLDSPLYQEICIDLEETDSKYSCDGGTVLKSVEKIPDTLSKLNINLNNFFKSSNLVYIDAERFKYQGCNKWLNSLIYTSVLPDGYLYLKSGDSHFRYLKSIKGYGVFADPQEAAKYSCDEDGENSCDFLEAEYPIEDHMVAFLIQCVVRELSESIYRPADIRNNATDDLDKIGQIPKNKNEQEQEQ